MRSLLYSLLSLATVVPTLAADAKAKDAFDDLDEKVPDTIFNQQTVPPMADLTALTLDKEISHGNWLVEYFSPSCPHCIAFKPTWQTLYEFYYTTKPLTGAKDTKDSDGLNSFTRYYDFKFAKVDCLVNKDICSEKGIEHYPSIIMYKDGNETKKVEGGQTLPFMSKWVEDTLETIRPGSRPQGGPTLPKVGATEVEAEDGKAKKVSSIATKVTKATAPVKAEATKATSTSNPSGISENLTAEKFQKVVTNTLDPWFIKFYAPWCGHCQAMAGNWAQMAREMKGKLNVGEVNCEVEKRLCKDARVKGYPTILFFRGGERIEYNGLRGIGDLIEFSTKALDVGGGVADVDIETFEKMEETEEVIFVYFYDHATTTEDFLALERLTLSLVGHAKIVKTNDPAMSKRFKISTWPRLMVSRDGKPSYYTYIAPKDMRDAKKVLNWMKTVWIPIVPELTSSNAREIMDGKIVVLGILSRERSDEFIIAKREIKNAALEWIDKQTQLFQLERQELRDAKQLRIEEAEDRNDQRALRAAKGIHINMDEIERKAVGFAWVDGVFWERWIRTTYGIDVKDGEKVVINDEDNKRYWDITINGDPIRPSRTSILETINKVVHDPPKISPKSTTGTFERIFFTMRGFSTSHPFITLGLVVGLLLVSFLYSKNRKSRRAFGNTGGFFQLNEKDGLLGSGNGGGKND